MKPEAARQRVEAFTKRFGEAHKYLAYHAAFPLALTPDLLYCLWANFQRDIKSTPLGIPWVAVADLLLSGLCDEVANETYEMDIAVRDELLGRLRAEPRFGEARIEELSEFLFDYVRRQIYSDDPDVHDFAQAQQWTALAYTKPGEAAEEIAKTLAGLNQGNRDEHLRMVSVLETLKQPLSEFTPLLSYARGMGALSRGQMEKAASHFEQASPQGGRWVQVAQTTLTIPALHRVAQSPPPTQEASSPNATVVTGGAIPSVEVTNSASQTVAPPDTQERLVFIFVNDYSGLTEKVEYFLHTINRELVGQLGDNTLFKYIRSSHDSPEQRWDEIQRELLSGIPFFIPILTPYFFDSPRCRQELEFFIEREQALRTKLIYPVYCEDAPPLEERAFGKDRLVDVIIEHQWADIRWFDVENELEQKTLAAMAGELAGTINSAARELHNVPPIESPRVINQEAQAQEAPAEQADNIAETPERQRPSIAFVSYAHMSNQDESLQRLIRLLSNELSNYTGEEFPILWDQTILRTGDVFEGRLQQARDNAAFLIPILTPAYFESRFCRSELNQFLEREKSSGRTGLIFPIHYVETRQLMDASLREQDPLAQAISTRLWADWRELRFELRNSQAVHVAIANLASEISIAWRELQDRRDVPRPTYSDAAETSRSRLKKLHELRNDRLINEEMAENLRKELLDRWIKDDQSIESEHGVTFEQKLKALKSVPLFQVLTLDELRELAVRISFAHYAGGQPIMKRNKPDDEMYIIRNGRTRISRNAEGKEITVGFLDEGANFGIRRFLLGDPANVTVSAETEGASCHVISRKSLRPILQRRLEIVDEMAKIHATRAKQSSIDIAMMPALLDDEQTPEETLNPRVVASYAQLIKNVFRLASLTSAPVSKTGKKQDKVSGSGATSKKAAKAKPQTQARKDRPQPTRRTSAKRKKKRRDRPAFSLDVPPDRSSRMEDWQGESLEMSEAASNETSIHRLREAARFSRTAASAAQAAASKKRPAKSGAAKKGSSKSAVSKFGAAKPRKSGVAKSSALRPVQSESPIEPRASASVSKRASGSSKRGSAKGGSRWSFKGGAKRGAKSAKSSKSGQQIVKKKKK